MTISNTKHALEQKISIHEACMGVNNALTYILVGMGSGREEDDKMERWGVRSWKIKKAKNTPLDIVYF